MHILAFTLCLDKFKQSVEYQVELMVANQLNCLIVLIIQFQKCLAIGSPLIINKIKKYNQIQFIELNSFICIQRTKALEQEFL